jgi:hypothetical protein
MKERTTQILLATVALLLLAHLVRPALTSSAQQSEPIPVVMRAQAIELWTGRDKRVRSFSWVKMGVVTSAYAMRPGRCG